MSDITVTKEQLTLITVGIKHTQLGASGKLVHSQLSNQSWHNSGTIVLCSIHSHGACSWSDGYANYSRVYSLFQPSS
jgi:hypothetical protein